MFKKERIEINNDIKKINGTINLLELKDCIIMEMKLETIYANKICDIYINDKRELISKTNSKGWCITNSKIEYTYLKDIRNICVYVDNSKLCEVFLDKKDNSIESKKRKGLINKIIEDKKRQIMDENVKLKSKEKEMKNIKQNVEDDEKYIIEVNNFDNLLKDIKKII